MLYVKDNNSWKPIHEIYVKNGGVWNRASKIHTKVNGVWLPTERVPDNVVILYSTTADTHPGFLCDGTNGTPNLLDKALALDNSTALQLGGNDIHSASEHGTFYWAYGTVYSGQTALNLMSSNVNIPYNPYISHMHTGGTFTLTDSIDLSGVGFTNLVPRLGGLYIDKDAVLLSLSTLTASFLTQVILSYYLRFSATPGNNSPLMLSSHVKTGLGETGMTETVAYGNSGTPSVHASFITRHSHAAGTTATMSHSSVVPRYISVGTFKTTQPITFDKLPPGTCILVTDSNLPPGYSWVDLSSLPRGLVKSTLSNYGFLGGSATHIHDTGGISPLGLLSNVQSALTAPSSSSGFPFYRFDDHTHHIDIGVSSPGNSMPAYVTLRLAKKN